MKNIALIKGFLLTFVIFLSGASFSQLADGFDIKQAYQQAKDKGISKSDVEGYVQFLHADYHIKITRTEHKTHRTPVFMMQELSTRAIIIPLVFLTPLCQILLKIFIVQMPVLNKVILQTGLVLLAQYQQLLLALHFLYTIKHLLEL